MSAKNNFKIFSLLCSIVIMISSAGCGFTHKISAKPFEKVLGKEKIPLHVVLLLSPDFCDYTFTRQRLGDWHVYPLGEAFCNGSKMLANAAFTEVSMTLETTIPPGHRIDAKLIPKLVSVNHFMPMWAWQIQEAVIIIEWKLVDINGKMIWVDTVQGKGRNKLGTTFTGLRNNQETMQMAVDDLFLKSLNSVMSSREIKRYASQPTHQK